MKKVNLLTLILAMVLMLSLFACSDDKSGGDGATNPADEAPVLTEVLAAINKDAGIEDADMKPIENADGLNLYYSIDTADVKQMSAERAINSSEDITEIVLVEAVDKDAATRVYDNLVLRYDSQKDLCSSYSPEFVATISECEVVQDGNFVSMIICDDYDTAKATYDSFF